MAKTKKYQKLPVQIKKAWLKALRGGEYLQGDGQLRRKEESFYTYCCLGVLCDIQAPRRWQDDCFGKQSYTRVSEGQEGIEVGVLTNNRTIILGDHIFDNRDLPNIKNLNAFGLDPAAAVVLANMNDSNKSFKVIANWIDKHL